MTFRHGQCQGKTKKGQCKVGAMDSHNKLCGPHKDQALKKAKEAFEENGTDSAICYAQAAEAMLDGEIEVDLPFLRTAYRNL